MAHLTALHDGPIANAVPVISDHIGGVPHARSVVSWATKVVPPRAANSGGVAHLTDSTRRQTP